MISPRWYQSEADDALWNSLFPYTGKNPIVVLPTGAGKSVVIAMFAERVLKADGRAIILQHRAELVKQNFEKVAALVGEKYVGIYSAGLKQRDIEQPIVLASIQSAYDKAHLFGRRHTALVDEAHLCPHDGDGMYRTFFDSLGNLNPRLRICGTTATPFRTDSGPLCSPDGLFNRVAYTAPMARLIAEGYLSPITNQPTETKYDTSSLHVRGGEYIAHEVEQLFSGDEAKVAAACAEIVRRCAGRRSIIVFAAGVHHAELVASHLERLTGEDVGVVVGTTDPLTRSASLAGFKSRRLRWLVGVDVLTTGFDAPCVDAIAVLRATESAGLFAQICGRGSRLFEGKTDCLLLDFGENLQRHGPLDSPDYGRRKGAHGETTGEAPVKACPNCGGECAASARQCLPCGFEFPRPELKHGTTADLTSATLSEPAKPETWIVRDWSAARHSKKWKRCEDGCDELDPGETCDACGTKRPYDTMRVDYVCEPIDRQGNLAGETIREWVCLEHEGFAHRKACQWWGAHSEAAVPGNIAEGLELFAAGALGRPTEITTLADDRGFRTITARVVPSKPATWQSLDADDPFTTEDDFAPRAFAAVSEEDLPF
jgi:DNA repair protein RadD